MNKSDEKRSWLESYVPLGIPLKQEVRYWGVTMAISTLWCLQFLLRYLEYRGSLYEIRGKRKILLENAKMPNFEYLTKDLFEIFFIVFLFCVLLVIYHYYYHYQGSKMMYLMRRLPNKWELHVRCFTLPVIGCVIMFAYMCLLRALFYMIYVFFTPHQCLVL